MVSGGLPCGPTPDLVLLFAERFQELYVLPTEGTGEASPSLFMLLQERLAKHKPRRPRRGEAPRSRILAPRHLDGASLRSWRNKLLGEVSCFFCVNVMHYVSPLGAAALEDLAVQELLSKSF